MKQAFLPHPTQVLEMTSLSHSSKKSIYLYNLSHRVCSLALEKLLYKMQFHSIKILLLEVKTSLLQVKLLTTLNFFSFVWSKISFLFVILKTYFFFSLSLCNCNNSCRILELLSSLHICTHFYPDTLSHQLSFEIQWVPTGPFTDE